MLLTPEERLWRELDGQVVRRRDLWTWLSDESEEIDGVTAYISQDDALSRSILTLIAPQRDRKTITASLV
jgi:hypothetical protein